MKRYLSCGTFLALLMIPASLTAGGYVQQSSFPLPMASIGAIDSDAVGNLYVLGLAAGATTYTVTGYRTPDLDSFVSFDTGLSSPVAFAVEASGVVDVLDGTGGIGAILLKRFQNNGAFLGQATYSIADPYRTVQWFASAIDKTNGRVYLTDQYWVTYFGPLCVGCASPPSGLKGFVNQFDLSGNRLNSIMLPGISGTPGTCYTPSKVAADTQGNIFVADEVCQQLFKYDMAGTLKSNVPAFQWSTYFSPRAMWTDANASLYISQQVSVAGAHPLGVAKLDGSANLQTQFAVYAPIATAWDNRILYVSDGSPLLKRYVFNNLPSVPVEIGAQGFVVQHSSSMPLAWQPSSDPDGDQVTYLVSLGSSPTQLVSIGSTTQPGLATPMLAAGTAYYWQVTAQDSYLGLPIQQQQAPVVSFTMSLVNSPPNSFGVAGGTGTMVTRAASVNLSWQANGDPDEDPVIYDVLWRPSSQSTQTVAGTTGQASWQMPGLVFGATYYWSVRARDIYGASRLMSGGAEQLYHPVLKNSPPAVPAALWGTGVSAQHTLTPQVSLAWSPVDDPDGDPVAYRLFMGTNPAALALVQDSAASSYSFAAPMTGTTYYWQASAYDPYGGASTAPVQSLYLSLRNSPPVPVVYLSTADVLNLHAASPAATFNWTPSTDPDGDPVSYELDLSTRTGSIKMAISSSTAMTADLQFETTYQWRVVATDPYGGVSTGVWMPLIVHMANQAPNAVQYLAPASLRTRTTSYLLAWGDTGDPDGDPVSYRFELGGSSNALAAVQSGSMTAYMLPLQYGTTAYYRVTAVDPFGATTTGPLQAFFAEFLNDPPQSPDMVAPFKKAPIVRTMKNSVTVSWEQVTNPQGDPITYTVYFGDSAGNMRPLATIAQAQQAGFTSLALRPLQMRPQTDVQTDSNTVILNLTGLDYYKNYYLRIAASNPYGAAATTGVQTFSLASAGGFPTAYNYPNPFNPNRGGTNIVFNAPPSGYGQATVEVYSEWQDLLFKQDYANIPPGISQVHFDGRDRNGKALFNGSYICRVRFSNPDNKQTFYMLVVK